MKLNNTGETSKDMGYIPPSPGTYIWMIMEGINVKSKGDGDGVEARSLQVPIEIVRVVDGEAKEGEKATYFINSINTAEMGEIRLNELLIWTGLIDEFAKHFPGELKDLICDETFQNKLYLKLLNKTFEATHNFREWAGKKYFNITNMGVVAKKGGAGGVAKKEVENTSGGDDW
jgi:hypothetical protein